MDDDQQAALKRFEDAQKATAPTREFADDDEWFEDYTDRVRKVIEANGPAEHVMVLSMEAMQRGEMFGYNRAVTEVLKQDTLVRFAKTAKQSLTWGETMGHLIMEGNTLPWLYHTAHEFDVLKHEDRAEGLTWAWTDAEWPEMYMDTDLWLDYFREVGFVEDHHLGTPPTSPLVLWRGATEVRMDGMAWTERPEVANWFAKRWRGIEQEEPVKVYRLEVYPEDVLAHFTGRNEAEWLVDPYTIMWENVEEFEVDSTEELRKPRRTVEQEESA
jgi:hypothetical protein